MESLETGRLAVFLRALWAFGGEKKNSPMGIISVISLSCLMLSCFIEASGTGPLILGPIRV